MTQKKVEQRALVVSSIINLIMAFAGIGVFYITNIHALFLDGAFSFIGFLSAISAIIISKVSKKTTNAYPHGLFFLEPLYAIFKSLLTLFLLCISVVSTAQNAYTYFSTGSGDPMNIGPVLPYSVAMIVLCFGLGFFNKTQNRKINNISTILSAESKSNMVDGILSFGVGVSIVLLDFVDINGGLGFLHYTGDFFVTTILVLISLKEPIVVLINAFRELSGGTLKDKQIIEDIEKNVHCELEELNSMRECKIFKIGMHIKVQILLKKDNEQENIYKLEKARESIIKTLNSRYDGIEIVYLF